MSLRVLPPSNWLVLVHTMTEGEDEVLTKKACAPPVAIIIVPFPDIPQLMPAKSSPSLNATRLRSGYTNSRSFRQLNPTTRHSTDEPGIVQPFLEFHRVRVGVTKLFNRLIHI